MDIYVTYLTVYSGNKLPPFYIGSSSLTNVNNGYRGSVTSKKYGITWKEEIKNNPQLFKTIIISKHNTRQEALDKEFVLQTKLNVVMSPMYINLSFATKKGFFGNSDLLSEMNKQRIKNGTHIFLHMNRFGKNNPSYDDTVHQFINETGETYIGTQYDFRIEYNLKKGWVSALIRGKTKTTNGWTIMGRDTTRKYNGRNCHRHKNNPRYDYNIYCFVHESGETFEGTIYDFRKKYNLHIKGLTKGRNKTSAGWSILGRSTNNNAIDYTIYHFIHESGEIFDGIQSDFRKKYNLLSSNVCNLTKGKRKTVKGWRLFV